MSTSEFNNTGVFVANYRISHQLAGGVSLDVSLLFSTQDKKVVGRGAVTQATNPPLDVRTELVGEYHYQCTNNSCFVMVNLKGVDAIRARILPPISVENVDAHILLNDDFKYGVANFRFLDPRTNEWVEENQVPVTLADYTEISDVTKLAEEVSA